MKPSIQAILLAAGFARRHPSKLDYKIDGKAALIHSADVLLAAGLKPVIVLGYHATHYQSVLSACYADKVRCILNPDYALGMATSIHAGLRASSQESDAYMIHLADKPFVKPETIQSLIATWAAKQPAILIPEYKDMHGHPALFRADLRDELLGLTGDVGANRLVRKMDSVVLRMSTQDKGITLDLDHYLDQLND